jgi:peptidoglycan/xylan/chitin deacetylase (PgdA/CDA1 family)
MFFQKLLKLIPACLIFFLAACKPAEISERNSLERENSSSLEDYTPALPLGNADSALAPPSRIWKVDEIDISDVDEKRKLIAFTFDDAPSRTLENILTVFAEFNESNPDCKASATIFFNGKLFDEQTPHLLYAACALGFELGNHTHSHYDLTSLNKQALIEEIDKTDRLLETADGKPRHLLRAPFGKINELTKEVAFTPIIDWTIDTLDWTGISDKEIYDSVFNNRFSGAIVLMHDGYEHTVSALKRLLPDLKANGYQVVSVSKMIKAHGCTFEKGKVYIRARKQN